MRRTLAVMELGGKWWVFSNSGSNGVRYPLPNGKFYAIFDTEDEANDFAANNLIYTFPKKG